MSDPFAIHIDIREAAALAKAFDQAPEIVSKELTAATWESELLLEREIKELTPVGIGAGGGLKGSISAREPRILADNVIGEVGTAMAHAVPVELGTKPHFPPIQPLADWAEHKLGLSHNEARSVGYLIARKIAVKGTQGAHMFERAFKANERQVQEIYSDARKRIAERIGGTA